MSQHLEVADVQMQERVAPGHSFLWSTGPPAPHSQPRLLRYHLDRLGIESRVSGSGPDVPPGCTEDLQGFARGAFRGSSPRGSQKDAPTHLPHSSEMTPHASGMSSHPGSGAQKR